MNRSTYAERYSESLEAVTGEKQVYRCPLCLDPTPIADASSLTWDHYPPRSVGGRRADKVLVCEACRQRWNLVDEELVRLRRRDAFDRKYPGMEPRVLSVPGERTVRGLRQRVAVDVQEGQIRFFGRTEINQEGATHRITEFLGCISSESGWEGLELRIASDESLSYSGSLVESAFLKTAFLAAFDWLGYPYVLSAALDQVRRQMLEPGIEHVSQSQLVFSPQPPGYDRQILLAYVHTPEALASLGVFLLGYHLSRWRVVFLPLPAQARSPECEKLEQTVRSAWQLDFVHFARSPAYLTDQNLIVIDQQGREWPVYRTSAA